MNNKILTITTLTIIWMLTGCSNKTVDLTDSNLNVVNREISILDRTSKSVSLNDKKGAGLAILKDVEFEDGTIEIDLKGENVQGKSFVGVAFNIQNDSTYEAIYFRPFNFQSKEKIRREHSIQYISHPKYTWRFLRTNNEGQFEAEYKRQPFPEEWFTVRIEIENKKVIVYDKTSNTILLSVERLVEPRSKKIGLWVGHNSKGKFRNMLIKK